MATSQERLALSLEILKELHVKNSHSVVKSSDMSRTHLTRLVKNGFLSDIIKGWYITTNPAIFPGDSTPWYISYWQFIKVYANERFGKEWSLSPDLSIQIHSGDWSVPKQIIIRSPRGTNNVLNLPYGTSLLDLKISTADHIFTEPQHGLPIYALPEAIIECSPHCYLKDSVNLRTCLNTIHEPSEFLAILIEKGQSTKAERIAGAFRNIGKEAVADAIINRMKRLGYDVREFDPFEIKMALNIRETSPYAIRIRMMWQQMREDVISHFPVDSVHQTEKEAFMEQVEQRYLQDAYHSLSIEGYHVSTELIEKVKSGNWKPDSDVNDREQLNAMAARGYWQAFQVVKESIKKIFMGVNSGMVVESDLANWHYELFQPSVSAGILKPSDLAGYRTQQVYIRESMHTPLNKEALRDAMPVLFDLLKTESNAIVRALLGHFIFVYIHPYIDGNGRLGRFLMNTMFASGGINWTVIPVERRAEYMNGLERASVDKNIIPFTQFIASLVIP